ncbi:hypothetical protein QTP86_000370 [Hemibagrus guttatus]|nr:hypothetical protein QTP86_000370 [Hemibagrus guttatus]
MENGRASGIDGLPAEFYKAFWAVIGQDVLAYGTVYGESVLHLPKEEGGQGLVQIASRTAAFHLQFLQRLLTGPKDLIWRPVAHGLLHKVRGLGLDQTLFLMDTKTLDVSGLPSFYRGLDLEYENKGCGTLHWLLEEPLIHGGRLDISGVPAPALSRALISSRVVTLRKLVNITRTDLSRAGDLAARLGQRSLRVVNQLLRCWRTVLTSKERVHLMDYQITKTNTAEEGSFPQLDIAPDLDGSEGPLLECRGVREMDFGSYTAGDQQYTLNVTRDIVRSLKALEIEMELQRLEATRNPNPNPYIRGVCSADGLPAHRDPVAQRILQRTDFFPSWTSLLTLTGVQAPSWSAG